jgi:hypothetical protein
VPTASHNPEFEHAHRVMSLPTPRLLALGFAALIEIAERLFGRRQRQFLDGLARRTAEIYATEKPRKARAFRSRLDSALKNRRLETVDWWEHGDADPDR